MINLTGRALLKYEAPFIPLLETTTDELTKLSNRFEVGDLKARIVSLKDSSGYNFQEYKLKHDFLSVLLTPNTYLYVDTVEGFRIQISLSDKVDYDNSKDFAGYVPSGIIKKYVTNIIDNPEEQQLARKNSEWMETVFKNFGLADIGFYVNEQTGAFHLTNVEDDYLQKEIYRKYNILTIWDNPKKELVLDFIYSEGKVDSGELAVDIFHIITSQLNN